MWNQVGQVSERLVDRISMAHDASHYLLTPRTVITARDAGDVARVFAQAAQQWRHVTLRSGGTSLSGQAVSDDILLDVRQNFREVEVLDGGARVRCQPGATIRTVNAHLARHGRRLGPDPASEIACTVGGVVANNSSGMRCGTERNTSRTLHSMVLVLPPGTVVDTSLPDADERLRRAEPELWKGLAELRDRVRSARDSLSRIAQQYAMKNTMGYGVNALVDFDEPVHILEHLVVGSEGTLGFVAEASFTTLPVHRHAATALLVTPELGAATQLLGGLVAGGATAVELMDAASLRVVQHYAEAPASLAQLEVQRHTALLVEATSDDADDLSRRVAALSEAMASPAGEPPAFTAEPAARAALWHLRKDLTTTPRRRIALLREIATRPPEQAAELRAAYEYEAVDSCAVDSLCARACPVLIDTGSFMKTFRAQRHGHLARSGVARLADAWGPALTGLRQGMRLGHQLPAPALEALSRAGRSLAGDDLVPLLLDDLPRAGSPRPGARLMSEPRGVLFASCLGRALRALAPGQWAGRHRRPAPDLPGRRGGAGRPRAGRVVLRHPVGQQGPRRRRAGEGPAQLRGPLGRHPAGRAARRRRCRLLHPRPGGAVPLARRGGRRALARRHGAGRHQLRRPGMPAPAAAGATRHGGGAPHLLHGPPGLHRGRHRLCRRLREAGGGAGGVGVLRLRGRPWHAAPGADRLRHPSPPRYLNSVSLHW